MKKQDNMVKNLLEYYNGGELKTVNELKDALNGTGTRYALFGNMNGNPFVYTEDVELDWEDDSDLNDKLEDEFGNSSLNDTLTDLYEGGKDVFLQLNVDEDGYIENMKEADAEDIGYFCSEMNGY